MSETMGSAAKSGRAGRVIASPRARRALRLRNLDPKKVHGSGPGGRIIESDVLAHAETFTAPVETRSLPQAREIYHLRAEIDASRLSVLLEKYTPHTQKKHGIAIELSHLLVHLLASALRACPETNVVSDKGAFVSASAINIALGKGNSRFVIQNADRLNLIEIAKLEANTEASAFAYATSLQLTPGKRIDEWTGTLGSNCSSVLAIGSLASRPFVRDGVLGISPTLRLCLSCDESAIARGIAVQFFEQIIEYMEHPEAAVFG